MKIDEQVISIIKDRLDINEALASSTLESLGADSLDYIDVIMYLENEFGVKISDDEAENLSTVQDAIDLIKEKTK